MLSTVQAKIRNFVFASYDHPSAVGVLLLVLLVSCILYIGITIQAANDACLNQGLERQQAAQIVARLLLLPTLILMGTASWIIVRLHRHRMELSRQLAQQNALLVEKDAARADLLAHASHDLRAPLTNMRMVLAPLQEAATAPDFALVKETCRQLDEEIEGLTTRIRNLLEMSRLEVGAWPMEKMPSDVTDIAACALERMRPLLQDREIAWDFPEEPLLVECDPYQIEAVIINLLENGEKYSPHGAPLLLRGRQENGWVRFEMEDRGSGIPPEEKERIFERFYRIPGDRVKAGTGLGLSICKAIIGAHGGSIGVEVGSKIGSRFWFTLPGFTAVEETR